jgi:hypothetical protein
VEQPSTSREWISSGNRAIGDVEAGDAAEARVILVDETRERALVAAAQRVDDVPAAGATTCVAPGSLAASIIPPSPRPRCRVRARAARSALPAGRL